MNRANRTDIRKSSRPARIDGRARPARRRKWADPVAAYGIAKPLVGIVMGSDSDWPVLEPAAEACHELGIPFEVRVLSAHRTPDDMATYARGAHERGLRVIIAGAGGAAHLPGMVASHSPLPVIGVPVESKALKGMDSLLSIVQMPAGVPVATVAINGGRNAGLLAVQIIGSGDPAIQKRLLDFKARIADESRAKNDRVLADVAHLLEELIPG